MSLLRKTFATLSVVATILLVGCNTTAVTTHSAVITGKVSAVNVKKAILDAGKKRKWKMTEISPSVIRAQYTSRAHSITVDVVYNTKTYEIKYVSSVNMKADQGKIHRKYNRWVANLDRDIQVELSKY